MGKVLAICISEVRGTQKSPVSSAKFIEEWGIDGDAHAGKWHRQVSLLSAEKIDDFKAKGAPVLDGAFGENLVVEGFDFKNLPVGTKFKCNDVVLEMTQIGKECHAHCQIYKVMGDCIMPREGVFARVLRGGMINVGDTLEIIEAGGVTKNESTAGDDGVLRENDAVQPGVISAAVITVSDKCSRGEREDAAGPAAIKLLQAAGYDITYTAVVPDEQALIEAELCKCADMLKINLIVTSGGTGFSVRDVTPEATAAVCERMAPGIAEAMRYESLKVTRKAMLSRAASGIRGTSLIINLPGSPKAVRENLSAVITTLEHGLRILNGSDSECGKAY